MAPAIVVVLPTEKRNVIFSTTAILPWKCLEVFGTAKIDSGNVFVRNGGGATHSTPNGLGNLIIGYDEVSDYCFRYKTGSHNLVVVSGHEHSGTGGVVFGHDNRVIDTGGSVLGGSFNGAGSNSVALGGYANSVFDKNEIVPSGNTF